MTQRVKERMFWRGQKPQGLTPHCVDADEAGKLVDRAHPGILRDCAVMDIADPYDGDRKDDAAKHCNEADCRQ